MSTNKNPAILHANQQEQQYNNQLYQHAYMPRGVEGIGYQLSQPHNYQQPAGTQQMPPLQPNTIRSNPQQQPQQQQQDVKMQHQLTQQHNATHRYNTMNSQSTYRSSQQPQLQPQLRVNRTQGPVFSAGYVLQNFPHQRAYFPPYQQPQFISGMPSFYPLPRPYANIQPNPPNLVPSTPPPLQQTIISPMPGPAAVASINQSKVRSRAVKIINPDTKEEVKVGNDESSASANDDAKHIHMEKPHYENESNYMTEYNPYVDAQTPVVSAMSDGPSVEISHKQKVKKKIVEVVEEKVADSENIIVDDYNSGTVVACSMLQTSAVEFQPSKPPPPIIVQSQQPIVDEGIAVDATLATINHVGNSDESYFHGEVSAADIEIVNNEMELDIQSEDVSGHLLATSSADETDKCVGATIPDVTQMQTETMPDIKVAANAEEVIEQGLAEVSLDSISSEESFAKEKVEEQQPQQQQQQQQQQQPPPPQPIESKSIAPPTVAKKSVNSLANTGFGNAIMEELKVNHMAQQQQQQQQQQSAMQMDVPIKRAASKSQTLLQYEKGQWSPSNAEGKKFYNREQMLALRAHPASQTQPPCQLGAIGVSSKYMQQTGGYKQVQRQNSSYGKRPSQNAQQGGIGNANKGSKSGMIHVSLSLREDVKLNETENAWKPSFISKDSNEVSSDEVLYKRVRGILNKLTPEKFDTLLEQIKSFNIDTAERLNGVIELVFEKAIDEPNFSVAYAQLCQKLSEKCFTIDAESKLAQFKKTLISKCQNEFQNHVIVDETKVAEKLQPYLQKINEATDPDRKAEYQANYEDEERKLRRRSVGTVHFIGELFKIGMLTPNIMLNCVAALLDRNSEDKLECLCKLLTTIGARLEEKKSGNQQNANSRDLGQYFNTMKDIVEKKNPTVKISSRVRFMIQDVIDLRKSNWVPRREISNPKKMGQIQKEADAEQSNIHLLNYNLSNANGSRRDDRGGGGGNRGDRDRLFNQKSGGRGGNNLSDDGWMTSSSKSRSLIDHTKFKSKAIDDSTTLGEPARFKWQGNSNTPLATTQTANSFSILEPSRSGSMGGNKDTYSKGSMERDRYDRGGNNSRSGSQHGSRENSAARNTYPMNPLKPRVASQSMTMMSGAGSSQTSSSSLSRPTPQQHTVQRDEPDEKTNNKLKVIADELLQYHNRGEAKLESCHYEVEAFPENYRWAIVRELYNSSINNHKLKSTDRVFAGQAVCHWINRKLITVSDNRRALKEFLEYAGDLVCDIPMLFVYVAEFVTPVIKNNSLTLKQIREESPSDHVMEQILQHLIPHAMTEYGPQFCRDLFKDCNWSDLMQGDKVKEFVSRHKFEFVKDKKIAVQRTTAGATNIELIQLRVKEFLRDGADISTMQEFLTVNLERIDKDFVRALSTVVTEHLMEDKTLQFVDPKYNISFPLLGKYIEDKVDLQMQCLSAIQILMNKLEYPKDALRKIFSNLYDEDVVSKKVILMWRDSKEMSEGKGVAVANLRTFFEFLEDNSSAEEDNN